VGNGKPGDHPVTDILVWQREVYGPELDALAIEVWEFLGQRQAGRAEAAIPRPLTKTR
jgi:hypothetical protein